MIMLYLDLINKVVVPKMRELTKEIAEYKKMQQQCLAEQQYIQKRIAREIELYKQRIKEKENA